MSTIDLREIGQQLKEARQSKSLTVDIIAEKTKLRKDQIIAIEEGDFDKLPPGPYVKGFIKLYSKAVGLDLFDQTAAATTVETPVPSRNKREPMKRSSISLDINGIIFFAVFLIIISLAVYLTIGYFTMPRNNIEVPSGPPLIIDDEDLQDEEDLVEEEEPVELAVVELDIVNNVYYYTVSNQESLEVVLKIDGDCWTDIKVDNESSSLVRRILTDEEVVIKATEQITIQAGNAKSATIIINGEEVEFSDHSGRRDAIITLEKSGE